MSAPSAPLIASGPHAFTDAELDAIEKLGDSLAPREGQLGGYNQANPAKRITRVASIDHNPQNMWIYDRMTRVVGILNQRFGFKLSPFWETFQFMVYRDVEGGHFNWHIDQGPTVKRQLSLTLQLTDGTRYQGCDLEFKHGDLVETAPRERGTLIAFPSHVLHRVTPITAGTRKSIVAWVP